jgi:hypothetical protein
MGVGHDPIICALREARWTNTTAEHFNSSKHIERHTAHMNIWLAVISGLLTALVLK